MFGLHAADATIVLAYLVIMLGIGFYLQKRMKTETDFFLSGRKEPSNVPVVYREFPWIPYLGLVYQFAMDPREMLRRAHAIMRNLARDVGPAHASSRSRCLAGS